MKLKSNLFGLLSRGVTATHPLCSVFILTLVFVFCSFSVSSRASVSNIPELSDWQFAQAIDAYAGLTDDQKDICNFLVGCNAYASGGLSNYNLASDFSSYADTIEFTQLFGNRIWDTLKNSYNNASNYLIGKYNDLSNFLGSAVSYARSIPDTFSNWLSNVGIDYNSTSEFRIHIGKDIPKDYTEFYGDQGLFNWQSRSYIILPTDFVFVWNTEVMSSGQEIWYNSTLSNWAVPYVRLNNKFSDTNLNTGYNKISTSSFYATYHNIFVNTTNNSCYLCDDNGNAAPNGYTCTTIGTNGDYVDSTWTNVPINPKTISTSSFSSIGSLFEYISLNPHLLLRFWNEQDRSDYWYPCLADFVTNLYVGSSWSDKGPWSVDYNLNLSPVSQFVNINSPTNVIYLDINGFLRDLYDNPTIIYNYVVNNSVNTDGDPVDSNDFKYDPASPSLPLSGISIGADFFKLPSGLSLFDTYIADLWRNTKDMVLYCADILNVFTLEDGGGLAYIVYGAISVGVIGGIFSKFLL